MFGYVSVVLATMTLRIRLVSSLASALLKPGSEHEGVCSAQLGAAVLILIPAPEFPRFCPTRRNRALWLGRYRRTVSAPKQFFFAALKADT